MIKINLISEEPAVAATRKKGPEISLGARQGDIILLTLLVIGIAVSGTRWFMLNSTINELRAVESERRAERNELQKYIDKVEELEAKRAELKKKIDTIRRLKEEQSGPVQILSEVSKALPDLVWLTDLNLSGTHLSMSGMALDENAIANYITNLDASPFFREPTLINFQRDKQDSFSFKLECDFTYTPTQIAAAGDEAES
jgi:type IV pilus assembly protein PilN